MKRLEGKTVEVKVIHFSGQRGPQEFVYRGEVFQVNANMIGVHKMTLLSEFIGENRNMKPTWFNTTSQAFVSIEAIGGC